MTTKILILTALPTGQVHLKLEQEVREIRESLQLAREREGFQFEHRGAVRWKDVRRSIEELQPQIVHFSGHGTGQAGLVFEDEQGKIHLVSEDTCARLFELFPDLAAARNLGVTAASSPNQVP